MKKSYLSNIGIQAFNDSLAEYIESLRIEKHNKTWTKLFFEEVLLKYQEVFGCDKEFTYNIKSRFSVLLIELYVKGESVDVLHPQEAGNETVLLDNLFNHGDGQVLYGYKNGLNSVSLSLPISSPKLRIPGSRQLHAIILGAIIGLILLNVLPQEQITSLVDGYISPIYSTLMGALKCLVEPIIFVSLVIGICTLEDLKTLSTIGKKTLLSFLGISTIMFVIATITCMFVFPMKGTSAQAFNLADLVSLLLSSIPTNMVAPFYEGNMIQIVVLGFIAGIVILILGEKATIIKKLILEFKFFFFQILELFVKALPFVVFLSVVKVILTTDVSQRATVWKIIVVDQLLVIVTAIICLVHTSIKTKVSIKILFKKMLPLFNVSLTTGSSTATIPEFYKRLPKYFGIDESYYNYWIPLSNAFFSPSTIMALIIYAFFSAQMQGVGITIMWIIILYIMIIQIGMATPRIPGGIIASCTILFTQLGLTTDQLGIIMAANVLILYLDTAVAAITRCCLAINNANKQGYCNLDVLKDDNIK